MFENKNVTTVSVECETDVWTGMSAARVLVSTIEYLLFQRNQIPFVFQTFKYMTSKWSSCEVDSYANFFVEKQRRLALSTIGAIAELTKNIEQESKQNTISTARIIFGATPLTPKEVYIIKMPEISKQHSPENHKRSLDAMTKNVIMSLLTSEDLYKAFSNNLGVTNMYLDIETFGEQQNACDNFCAKQDSDFPIKCPIVFINLIHKQSSECNMNCCRDIIVFQSINELKLSDDDNIATDNDAETFERPNSWKEAKVFVKGFKDIFVKGRSIW